MKKLGKKNQVIIAALTLMIACAGYLNFAGKDIDLGKTDKKDAVTGSESAFAETDETGVYDENIELNSDEDDIGEAVLTSTGNMANSISAAKLSREQTRSVAKENYLQIINDDSLSEETKKEAVDSYVKLEKNMEKESAAENQLQASGFTDALVSVTEKTVEVTLNKTELTEDEKIKVENTLVTCTGCTIDMVVINLVSK